MQNIEKHILSEVGDFQHFGHHKCVLSGPNFKQLKQDQFVHVVLRLSRGLQFPGLDTSFHVNRCKSPPKGRSVPFYCTVVTFNRK